MAWPGKNYKNICSESENQTFSPAPWNYLWKPGPYPEGTDERIAAAKKYGMIVEDYRPYEDKDVLAGDYPMLPIDPMAERWAF